LFDGITEKQLQYLVSRYVDIPVPTGDANREDLHAVSTYPTKWGDYAIARHVDETTGDESFSVEYTSKHDWSTTHILSRNDKFEDAKATISDRIWASILHDSVAQEWTERFGLYFAQATLCHGNTYPAVAAE
jgi:hypothetical protein